MDFGPKRERGRLRVGTEIIYKVTGHLLCHSLGIIEHLSGLSYGIIVVYCVILIYCCLCDFTHSGNMSLGCCAVPQPCVVCYPWL
jgi:hypothetical protein